MREMEEIPRFKQTLRIICSHGSEVTFYEAGPKKIGRSSQREDLPACGYFEEGERQGFLKKEA